MNIGDIALEIIQVKKQNTAYEEGVIEVQEAAGQISSQAARRTTPSASAQQTRAAISGKEQASS